MRWVTHGNRWLSGGYHIHRCTRGFEVWWKTKDRYVILARELASLPIAKEFAEKHRKGTAPISEAQPAGAAP